MNIEELTTEQQFVDSYPVMHELRTDLELEQYLELLAEMLTKGDYRLFAVREDGSIVALAGVGFGTNLYYRRYLWVYDLVTTEKSRSSGHGKALLDYLEELARNAGCNTLALASGLQRGDAHRFYEGKVKMKRMSYTFVKGLR